MTKIPTKILASLAVLILPLSSMPAAERNILHTKVPATVAHLQLLGRLPATNRMRLAIGLPLRNQNDITKLFHQLYDTSSTNFHHYLSPEEFTEQFGPTELDFQKVIDYAKSNRMEIVRAYGNRALVVITGSVADVEGMFHVHLGTYQHPAENRQFYAPDVEPSVDPSLPILYVSGMDNFVSPHPSGHRVHRDKPQIPMPSGGSDPSNALYMGNDFRAAYFPENTLTGAGQVVGLWEEDGYTPGDIAAYISYSHLSTSVQVTNCLETFTPGKNNDEVVSDIELAIAMAPGLKQVNVYEGSSHVEIIGEMSTPTNGEPRPNQISCSWGMDGDTNVESGLIQLALQGQTFLYAVGDSGAYPNGINDGTEQDFIYMTAVGGTQLFMNGAGVSWQSEKVWHDTPGTNYNYFSSTGGVLPQVPIPDYQKEVSMALNHGSTQYRNVPDVALVARDIMIFFTQTFTNSSPSIPGQYSDWVGTSAAAPLWSGIIAMANQEAAQQGKPPVGFLNPALYQIAESSSYAANFHDITNGSSTWSNTITGASSLNLYYSTNGYDLCTGWGTPASTALLDAFVSFSGPVFVDFTYNGVQDGNYATPFHTLAGGINKVSTYGTIIIKTAGSSTETMTISKPMTITASDGAATVGN